MCACWPQYDRFRRRARWSPPLRACERIRGGLGSFPLDSLLRCGAGRGHGSESPTADSGSVPLNCDCGLRSQQAATLPSRWLVQNWPDGPCLSYVHMLGPARWDTLRDTLLRAPSLHAIPVRQARISLIPASLFTLPCSRINTHRRAIAPHW